MLCLFAANQAFASGTRLLSLGLDNWQTQDDSNYWFNPALIKAVPDTAVVEIGDQTAANAALTGGSQWGGFAKSLGDTTFALFIRRPYQLNDFSSIANPNLTPGLGGFITNVNVVGVTGLDTAGFGANGPFGATGTGILGIGAAAVPQRLAVPANYFDLFFAFPLGPVNFGLKANYAANAPGEVSRSNYTSTTGTSGTVKRDRSSDEMNLNLGAKLKLGYSEEHNIDAIAYLSKPAFSMYSRELRTTGEFSTSRILSNNPLNMELLARYSYKTENASFFGVTVRTGAQEVSGKAGVRTDSTLGGALETDRNASFKNERKWLGGDITWTFPFGTNQIIASAGLQTNRTVQSWTFTDVLTPASNQRDSLKIDNMIVPVRIATELRPLRSLAIRAGIQKNIFATTKSKLSDSDAGAAPTVTETDTVIGEAAGTTNGVGLSFGVGWDIMEQLVLDTVVRQTFLFNGPQVVGGAAAGGTVGGFIARATLSYRFGEAPDAPVKKYKKWD
ncbi:MAG TPA: hypothetical protein PKI19_06830 [Elusimicrobiales bacterium]|nr:hypothetical protein [Elusimicrobiales bacterium]